jgi:hypothetical protein
MSRWNAEHGTGPDWVRPVANPRVDGGVTPGVDDGVTLGVNTALEDRLRESMEREAARAPLRNPVWPGPLDGVVRPLGDDAPLRGGSGRRLGRIAVAGAAAALMAAGAVGAAALAGGDGNERATTVADEPPGPPTGDGQTPTTEATTAPHGGTATASSVACFSSGDAVRGDGRTVTETRELGGRDGGIGEIEVRGCVRLEIRTGDPSLTLTADGSVVPLITSEVDGDRLEIGLDGSFVAERAPLVVVTVPRLVELDLSGAVDATVEGVDPERFVVRVDGAGDVTVTGATRQLTVRSSGAADADLSGLTTIDADVEVDGAASVTITASGRVEAEAEGVGSLVVGGSAQIDASVGGAAEVRRADGTVVASGPVARLRSDSSGDRSEPDEAEPGSSPQKGPRAATPETAGGGSDPSLADVERRIAEAEAEVDRRVGEIEAAIDAYTDCVDAQIDAGAYGDIHDACGEFLPR